MFPTKEQVAEVLRCCCGSPYKMIQHLVNTHKSSGEIPSHEEGCINMHPIVSKHYKVIVSMRELAPTLDPMNKSLGEMFPSL